MLLADRDILEAIALGQVGLDPYNAGLVQPASIDLRLSPEFRLWPAGPTIDPVHPPGEDETELFSAERTGVILQPGRFMLGATVERVRLPDWIAGRVEGKSTLGRCGLMVHSTAGWIDPGFYGQVTLELSNVNDLRPIKLTPGMRIAQLSLFRLSHPAMSPYRGRYQHSTGPHGPRPTHPP